MGCLQAVGPSQVLTQGPSTDSVQTLPKGTAAGPAPGPGLLVPPVLSGSSAAKAQAPEEPQAATVQATPSMQKRPPKAAPSAQIAAAQHHSPEAEDELDALLSQPCQPTMQAASTAGVKPRQDETDIEAWLDGL